MTALNPFDRVIEDIRVRGYHNHRLESHSDIVSRGILDDLLEICPALAADFRSGVVKHWLNVSAPGDRGRRIDLFVGEPDADGKPDIRRVRIAVENKSVATAHRNKDSRFDDLKKTLDAIHGSRQETVIVATVLVGLADRVLNVPDQVKKFYKARPGEFEKTVLPRLSTGDETLWTEFAWAVSKNRPTDPASTVNLFQKLPVRKPGHSHIAGYDYVLLVPVQIDNVNPPHLPRPNPLGIDVDRAYREMLEQMCKAYTARWHL